MTPNNICNMAFIKGLDLIAVTDHNSTKNLPAIAEVAASIGLKMLYGAELETSEEVHVLGLFSRLEKALKFQEWIDSKMPSVKNDEDYFGHQWIMNSRDEKIGDEERLLLVSLSATLEETVAAIHEYGGRVILAHVLDRANSVTHQLGFIPMELPYDGLEVKNEEQRLRVIETNPWVT
ncbi:MAG: PHP domain-containing protein, partial [Erysipelotrichaceae bacterium]|nr:PHP domain-containing protein [Erysipelotrichaceae bacterium]